MRKVVLPHEAPPIVAIFSSCGSLLAHSSTFTCCIQILLLTFYKLHPKTITQIDLKHKYMRISSSIEEVSFTSLG
jgi:hypothetical protein